MSICPTDGDDEVNASKQLNAPTRFGLAYVSGVAPSIKPARGSQRHCHGPKSVLNTFTVTRVHVAKLSGMKLSVILWLIVRACEGNENARLHLASHCVQRAGFGNTHDLVEGALWIIEWSEGMCEFRG